jgi:glycine cleavage system H protein
VKAASEIYSPASGTVIAINTALTGEPGLINTAPETEGWIFKLALDDAGELDGLMDATAYAELTK